MFVWYLLTMCSIFYLYRYRRCQNFYFFPRFSQLKSLTTSHIVITRTYIEVNAVGKYIVRQFLQDCASVIRISVIDWDKGSAIVLLITWLHKYTNKYRKIARLLKKISTHHVHNNEAVQKRAF